MAPRSQSYISWKTGRSRSRLFWLSGIPGSGKTILCSRVIDDVRKIQDRDARVAVLFFYCPEIVNSRDIFSSLLRQLLHTVLSNNPALPDALELDHLTGSLDDLPLTDILQNLSGVFKRTFIIIDALDRCRNLGDALLELRKLAQTNHVFASSRDYLNISSQLGTCPSVTISQLDIEGDVRRYVENKIEILNLHGPMSRKPIVDTLVQRAQGTFLWLVHQIRALRRARSDHEIGEALATVPPGLLKFVVSELDSINSKPHSNLLFSMLRLVACAKSPITSRALSEAAQTLSLGGSVVLSDAMSLFDDFGGLISCVPATQRIYFKSYWTDEGPDAETSEAAGADGIVVFPHPSLRQALLADPTILPASHAHHALPLNAIHDGITRLCLTHLNFMLRHASRKTIVGLPDSPFAMYALNYWLGHVHASGKDVEKYKDLMTPWRGIKATKWVPGIVHMAVRLNMAINKALPESSFTDLDVNGLRPLHVALKNSAPLSIIEWLLEHVDVNQASGCGAAALHFAAMYHREPKEAIERLLVAGADVNATATEGITTLHILVRWDVAEDTESYLLMLLDRGANVNAQDDHARTALHTLARYAGQADYVELIAKCLVKHGARVGALDKEGRTPLHEAAEAGCVSLVLYLLRNGALVDAIDTSGDTPLALALKAMSTGKFTPHELIVQLLLDYNANISQVRNYPVTTKGADPSQLGESDIITSLRQELAMVRSDSNAKSKAMGELEKELAHVKEDGAESRKRLMVELESSKFEVTRQSNLPASVRAQLETAQAGSNMKSKTINDLEEELARVKKDGAESNQRLAAELESSRSEATHQSILAASFRERLERVQHSSSEKNKAVEDLEKELAQVKKAGAELNQRIAAELESSKHEVARQFKFSASLREQLKKVKMEIIATTRSKVESDLEKESAWARNRSLEDELASLEHQLKEQSSLVISLRRELEKARLELNLKDENINNLLNQMDLRWDAMTEDAEEADVHPTEIYGQRLLTN